MPQANTPVALRRLKTAGLEAGHRVWGEEITKTTDPRGLTRYQRGVNGAKRAAKLLMDCPGTGSAGLG
ncbi:hypothetical protein DFAR_920007 [Desulfarculales bacterium]